MNINCISLRWKRSVIPVVGLLALVTACSDNGGSAQPDYQTQAELVQVVAHMSPIRMAAVEYRYNNGAFPESLNEIDIDPEKARTSKIENIRFNQGQIIATGTEYKGWVSLTPKSVMDGSHFEWHCATNVEGMVTPGLKCNYSETVPEHP